MRALHVWRSRRISKIIGYDCPTMCTLDALRKAVFDSQRKEASSDEGSFEINTIMYLIKLKI